MRVYRYGEPIGPAGLTEHDEPLPAAQRGELLLRVRSVSLNYRDLGISRGEYVVPITPHLVPCSDAVAEVVEVGEGVTDFAPGDRVLSTFHARWFGGAPPVGLDRMCYGSGRDGWLTEYKAVSHEAVVRLGDSLTDEQAATLPCAGVTAWAALAGPEPIRAGHTVLTLGSGGVSIAALQLSKALGARVIATTSSETKAAALRELGADEVVNYRTESEWGERVREITDGRGVDRVVEVGGPGTIGQSLRAVAVHGEVVLIGWLTKDNPGIDYFQLKGSAATVRSVGVGTRDDQTNLLRAVTAAGLTPVVDRVFDFDHAPAAFEHLDGQDFIGKIVVTLG
jgi:NADPH:quinone reductase-like Zn-dependent oxidoreductase